MCRFRKICFSILAFFIMSPSVWAVSSLCEFSEVAELNKESSNIKGNYEEKEGIYNTEENPIPDEILGTEEEENYVGKYNYFEISIINLSENFYIEVSNDYNRERMIYEYKDSVDGTIKFDWKNLDKVTNFTIKVYSSGKTNCPDELYRTITVTTPRYNDYYDYMLCDSVPDYYLCEKYVQFDYIDEVTFLTNIERYLESKQADDEQDKDEDDFVAKHKTLFIVGGVLVVVITGVVVAVIIKKRRSSDEK